MNKLGKFVTNLFYPKFESDKKIKSTQKKAIIFLPSLEVLLKIIEVCGVTVEEFFYSDIENYEQDKQILNKLKGLPRDKREALLNLLK